jgi:hypothetical protein
LKTLRLATFVTAGGFTRKSRGGFAGPFEGTCAILEGISETLAKDVVDWTGLQRDAKFDADLATHARAKAQSATEAASGAK